MARALTTVIASLEQASPQWLTGVLRREHLLLSGEVLSVESRQGTVAFLAHA